MSHSCPPYATAAREDVHERLREAAERVEALRREAVALGLSVRWLRRSRGGSDFDLDLLVAPCRWCHDQTDAPCERGRLVVTALGAGQFTFEIVQRAGRGPLKPGPTFAHVGKTDARDVVHGPDWTTVNSQSDAP